MDVIKELLLSVQTSLENKGPYKLLIKKGDSPVQTLKIRMKDDVTFILQITQGDYTFVLLKNDKEYLSKSVHIYNFETGSQLQILINDSIIEIKDDGLIKYKSVDELVEIVEKTGKGKSQKDKVKQKKLNKETKEKSTVDKKPHLEKKIENKDKVEAKPSTSLGEQVIDIQGEKVNVKESIEEKITTNASIDFIAFIKSQQEINQKLQNQIDSLQKELTELKASQIELQQYKVGNN